MGGVILQYDTDHMLQRREIPCDLRFSWLGLGLEPRLGLVRVKVSVRVMIKLNDLREKVTHAVTDKN